MDKYKNDIAQPEADEKKEQSPELFEFNPPETLEERLNASLDQLNRELDSCYAAVGKEYYEANAGQVQDENMASLFQNIVDKKEEVQKCMEQIRKIKEDGPG